MAYKILEIIGYYRIKKNVKHRVFCRKLQKEDAKRKQEVRKAIEAVKGVQLKKSGDSSDIIVSLTSYGPYHAHQCIPSFGYMLSPVEFSAQDHSTSELLRTL